MADNTEKLITLGNLQTFKTAMDASVDTKVNGAKGLVSAEEARAKAAEEALDAKIANAVGGSMTTQTIKVLGGPLADDVLGTNDNWPTDWYDANNNPCIPENITLQEALTKLFYAEKWGSVGTPNYKFEPKFTYGPTVTLSPNASKVPVGTKVAITFSTKTGISDADASVSCGDFTYGFSTNGTSKTSRDGETVYSQNASASTTNGDLAITSATFNGSAITSGDEVVIESGKQTVTVTQSGITVKPGKFAETSVYDVSNVGNVGAEPKFTISDAAANLQDYPLVAKSTTKNITGYYPVFVGQLDDPKGDAYFTGEELAKCDHSIDAVPTSVKILEGTATFFIAVPEGDAKYNMDSIDVYDPVNPTVKFGASNKTDVISVPMLNDSENKNYKVFYISNAQGWDNDYTFGINFVENK